MRRRFFVHSFGEGTARVEGDTARHLARVLRAAKGQLYELSDGRSVFLARIEGVGRDTVEFSLVAPVAAAPERMRATVLLAIVKFDRFEWALEKATELGASAVIPLAAERSEANLVAAAVKRAERWQKIVAESAQQARRLRPPEVLPLRRPRDAFREVREGLRVLLSEREGVPRLREVFEGQRRLCGDSRTKNVELAMAVGPEGGWTEAEFAAAAEAGFSEAGLGNLVLRTETAVAAGLGAAHLYFDS